MNVWVTRSQPGADALAEVLEDAGHRPWVAPVMRIESIRTQRDPAADANLSYAVCIVLSGHAVPATPRGGQRYLAVGPATARLLEAHVRAPVEIPARHNSEGVVEWLDAERPESVLLMVGDRGRGLVDACLRRLAIRHEVRVAYRRLPVSPDVKFAQIDALEVGSGDGAQRAAQVWFAAGGDADVPVLVPSARVGEIAVEAGFRRVVVCPGPSAQAFVDAISSNLG